MGLQRPAASEHHEYYAGYIALVPAGDVVETMRTEMEATQAVLASVPAEKETFAYAPGKWTMREVLGHLIDVERVFAFRALWFARGAPEAMPGMEQNEWAASCYATHRPLSDLAAEWAALREANTMMFAGFDPDAGTRSGIASGTEVTVRALAYMMVGHEIHHRRLLQQDYLGEDA